MAAGTTATVVKTIGLRRILKWCIAAMAVLAVPTFFAGYLFISLFSTPAAATEPEGGTGNIPEGAWVVPLEGVYIITSPFGYRPDVYPHDHFGIDLSNGCGQTVRAATAGVVTFSGWTTGGWGNRIIVAHADGSKTGYAHMQMGSLLVKEGDPVEAGQPIGLEGNTGVGTGCHLHFETFINGIRVNPVPFMSERGVTF